MQLESFIGIESLVGNTRLKCCVINIDEFDALKMAEQLLQIQIVAMACPQDAESGSEFEAFVDRQMCDTTAMRFGDLPTSSAAGVATDLRLCE